MTAATNVVISNGRQQFQGVFSEVKVVKFTLDTASINANSTAEDTVAVPGVEFGDVILGWGVDAEPSHDLMMCVHAATDALHILTHNNSGGSVNPASADWTVVVGRTVR
jgi:hypothetical protein